jgi:hypothetical protein
MAFEHLAIGVCPPQVRKIHRSLVVCIRDCSLHATVVVFLPPLVSAHNEDNYGDENGNKPSQGTDDDTDDVTFWCLLLGSFLWLHIASVLTW